jgi:hypothetical protein
MVHSAEMIVLSTVATRMITTAEFKINITNETKVVVSLLLARGPPGCLEPP